MLRAHLKEEKRCYLHPHRVVRTACARCKTPYCDDCLETRDDGVFARIVASDERQPPPLFCARCVDEVEVLNRVEAERRRPIWQRLRPTAAGMRRASIYVAVVAVVMVPMLFAVRNLATTTLTPEELARIRLGLMGGFETLDGVNLVSNAFNGTFIRATVPARPGNEPSRLIDSWATPDVPGWRSDGAAVPLDLVFALSQQQTINTVVLKPHPTEPRDSWVRDFDLLVSVDSPETGFTRVVSGRLPNAGEDSGLRLRFGDTPARYVMLRVLSNNGSSSYTSLGEMELYWSQTASQTASQRRS